MHDLLLEAITAFHQAVGVAKQHVESRDYNEAHRTIVQSITVFQNTGLSFLKSLKAAKNMASNGSTIASSALSRVNPEDIPPALR